MRQAKYIISYLLVIFFLPGAYQAQSQALMSHSGHGLWGNTFTAGAGIALPQVGSPFPDMTGAFGFGIGNPYKNLGIQLNAWMTDVSEQSGFTLSAKFHRYVGCGTRVAFGVNHFIQQENAQVGKNKYLVLSHDFSANFPNNDLLSRIAISLGYGTGRFQQYNFETDIIRRTGFFGTFDYQILKKVSWSMEWDGFEWNTGITIKERVLKMPMFFMIGAADINRKYSGNIRMIAAIGIGYDLW